MLGAFVQAQRLLWVIGTTTIPVPWGATLTLLVLFLVVRGGVHLVGSAFGGAAVMAGWLAVTLLLSVSSPWGDLIVSGGIRQLVYLFGGTVVGAALATFPVRRSGIRRNSDVR